MLGKIMGVLSGGPDAIKKMALEFAPEMLRKLHDYYRDKVTLEPGESCYIVCTTPVGERVAIFAAAVHDETGKLRVLHKGFIDELINDIPNEQLKISGLLG
jgi:hypothetical protein